MVDPLAFNKDNIDEPYYSVGQDIDWTLAALANPHVFTEQGLYMLMTVLKGPLAVKQSKALIRIFKKMKDYILENLNLIGQRELLQRPGRQYHSRAFFS